MEDEEDETVQEKSFAEDERVQFVGLRLAHLLRLKEDKWNEFLEEERNQKLVTDFLESNRPDFLAFYLSVAGGLAMETKVKGRNMVSYIVTVLKLVFSFSVCGLFRHPVTWILKGGGNGELNK